MKTWKLFITVTLSAACLMLSPQRGYSPNVVGYVNLPITNGLNYVNNPLDDGEGDSLTNILSNISAPNGAQVFVWNVSNQVFSAPSTYNATNKTWTTNYALTVGLGFVVSSPSSWTITIVGTVEQGTLTNFVAGSNKFSFLGNQVPQTGQIASANVGFPGIDGASVYTFNPTNQHYSDAFTYFNNFGWFDPDHAVDVNGPVINVGQAFFVQNPGPDINWVRNFRVSSFPQPPNTQLAVFKPAPDISRIAILGNKISLQIQNGSGSPYDLQFSTDGRSWQTVAASQTSAIWTGPAPAGTRGYYQAIRH